MALTLRTNGSGPQNLVNASWWNDFYNLLTGAMLDQPVTLRTNLTLQVLNGAPASAPTSVVSAGGSLGVGTYKYAYTWVSADGGESLLSPTLSTATTTGNTTETLTFATGPAGTAKRNIYRSKVGVSSLVLLATINDNTTTSYVDSAADSALSNISPPSHSTFGGSIFINDQNGTLTSIQSFDGTTIGNQTLMAFGGAPAARTAVVAAGGSMGVGVYKYAVAFAGIDGGETTAGQQLTATTTTGNQTVNLTLPIGPVGTAARSIYRTQVGGATFYLLAKVNGNTVTTYTDSAADASLNTGRQPLAHPTFGGSLIIRDNNNVTTLTISSDGTIGSPGDLIFSSPTSTYTFPAFNTANVTIIKGGAGIGFNDLNNVKLMEIKGSGNMVIQGNTIFTNSGSSIATASGGFDAGYDIAETYPVDQVYASGMVVCPVDTNTPIPATTSDSAYIMPTLTQCTHDGCNLAHVVSRIPGFSMGYPNLLGNDNYDPNKPPTQPMALSGRVFVKTANDIPARSYVCSDGRGGVRAVLVGEKVMALGVSLAPTNLGTVPVIIRPMFVSL